MAKSPAKAKSPKPPVVKIRDRITELRRVKASDLIDNPRNWRSHPVEQLAALDAVLKEIGFAGAELAIETPEGLMLIDGHARKKLAGDEVIPVLVTDLTEAEANLILATFDPIGAMAEADAERLQALLDVVSTTDQDLADMLTKLAEDNGVAVPAAEITEDEIPEPPAVPITKPGDLWLLGVYYECECGEQHDLQELPDRVPGQPLQPEVLQRRMPEPSTEGRKSKVQANRKGRGDRSSMASKPGKKRIDREYYTSDQGRAVAVVRQSRLLQKPYYQNRKRLGQTAAYRKLRAELIREFGACQRCGTTVRLTIDHVIPMSLGGQHTRENVQLLCAGCNSKKKQNTIRYAETAASN